MDNNNYTNTVNEDLYFITDSYGNPIACSAEEYVKKAIEDGWTITYDVASAIKQLLGWD